MVYTVLFAILIAAVKAQVSIELNHAKNVTICKAQTTVYTQDNANSIFTVTKIGPGDTIGCGDTAAIQLVGTQQTQYIACTEGAVYAYTTETGIGVDIAIRYCSNAGSDCVTTSPMFLSNNPTPYSEFSVLDSARCLPSWLYPATILPPIATAIGTSNSHACMLDDGGTVYCWGSNDRCQTGVGTQGQIVASPTRVPYAANVTSIKIAQDGTTCVQLSTLDIICWGKDALPNEQCVRSIKSKMALAVGTTWTTAGNYYVLSGGVVVASADFTTWVTTGNTGDPSAISTIGSYNTFDTSIVGMEWTRYPVYQLLQTASQQLVVTGNDDIYTLNNQATLVGLLSKQPVAYTPSTCTPVYIVNQTTTICSETTGCLSGSVSINASGYLACGNRHGTIRATTVYPRALQITVSDGSMCRLMLDKAVYCTGAMSTGVVQYYGTQQAAPISQIAGSTTINQIGTYRISSACNATLASAGCNANLTVVCANSTSPNTTYTRYIVPAAAIRTAHPIATGLCIVTSTCANPRPWYTQFTSYPPITSATSISASASSFCILASNGIVSCSGQPSSCTYILPLGGVDTTLLNPAYQPWQVSQIVSATATTCFVDTTKTKIMCSGNVPGYYTWCSRQTVLQYTTQAPLLNLFIADAGMICITLLQQSGGILLQCLWNGYNPSIGSSTTNAGFVTTVNITNMAPTARVLFDYIDGKLALTDDTMLCIITAKRAACTLQAPIQNRSYVHGGYIYSPSPFTLLATYSPFDIAWANNIGIEQIRNNTALETFVQQPISWYTYGDGDVTFMTRTSSGVLFLMRSGKVICSNIATCGQLGQYTGTATYSVVGTWTPTTMPPNITMPSGKKGLASPHVDGKRLFAILFIAAILVVAVSISAYVLTPGRRHGHYR